MLMTEHAMEKAAAAAIATDSPTMSHQAGALHALSYALHHCVIPKPYLLQKKLQLPLDPSALQVRFPGQLVPLDGGVVLSTCSVSCQA